MSLTIPAIVVRPALLGSDYDLCRIGGSAHLYVVIVN